MNKNNFAVTPPMGWNSYDYYDTTVNEAQIRANAEYMAKHLKKYGWEYVVIDIEWYSNDAGTQRDKYQYIPLGMMKWMSIPDSSQALRDSRHLLMEQALPSWQNISTA